MKKIIYVLFILFVYTLGIKAEQTPNGWYISKSETTLASSEVYIMKQDSLEFTVYYSKAYDGEIICTLSIAKYNENGEQELQYLFDDPINLYLQNDFVMIKLEPNIELKQWNSPSNSSKMCSKIYDKLKSGNDVTLSQTESMKEYTGEWCITLKHF